MNFRVATRTAMYFLYPFLFLPIYCYSGFSSTWKFRKRFFNNTFITNCSKGLKCNKQTSTYSSSMLLTTFGVFKFIFMFKRTDLWKFRIRFVIIQDGFNYSARSCYHYENNVIGNFFYFFLFTNKCFQCVPSFKSQSCLKRILARGAESPPPHA